MAETLRQQKVRCGKRRCRTCPHGPYWYAFWSEGGRTRSRYIGKEDPRVKAAPNPDDAILNTRTATVALAKKILGLGGAESKRDAISRYRQLCKDNHPDRGGNHLTMARINAAWEVYERYRGWA